MRRLRSGEWLAGGGAVALAVLLSVRWYDAVDLHDSRADRLDTAGWTALGLPVVALLALTIALALALVVLTATRRSPAMPVGASVLAWLVAAIAACALLVQLLAVPDLGVGLAAGQVHLRWPGYAGLAATALTAAGAFRAMRDERTDAPESAYTPPEPRPAPAERPRGDDA